jgi:hypothetical protein
LGNVNNQNVAETEHLAIFPDGAGGICPQPLSAFESRLRRAGGKAIAH